MSKMTVTVSRQFRDNLEKWSAHRIATGQWTAEEIEGLREMLRTEIRPGPDQFRQGVTVLTRCGVAIPATIDDHEERYRLWDDFFADEVRIIAKQEATA